METHAVRAMRPVKLDLAESACSRAPLLSCTVGRLICLLQPLALLFLTAGLVPLGAQTTNRFAGPFEERFLNTGKVTPIFTRPDSPAPPTSIEVSPPTNLEPQRAVEAVETNGSASAMEERITSRAQTGGSPGQPRSDALPQPFKAQARTDVPTSPRQTVAPGSVQAGRRIASGRATWYEQPGRTASGEMFDPNRLTAAHRTLPFGTRLRVVNPRNGRSVLVRINDRSPPTLKSVLNLSRGSARAIGITGAGLVTLYKLD